MATPIFAPDGSVRNIPDDQVQSALGAGGVRAVQMQDPKGILRYVRETDIDAAQRAGGLLIPGMPKVAPDMQESALGTLAYGLSTADQGTKPGTPEYDAEMRRAEPYVRGATTGMALGQGAAAIPGVLPWLMGGAIGAVKAVPTIAAMEGINWARKNVPGGKYIPPGAEWLPVFLGNKGKAAGTAKAEGAAAEEAAAGTGQTSPVPPSPSSRTVGPTLEQELRRGLGSPPPPAPGRPIYQRPTASAPQTVAVPAGPGGPVDLGRGVP